MSLSDNDYELLSAYIDNQLTDDERITLEARLLEEPELQEELEALRSVTMLVGNLPTLKAPRDFTLTAEMVGAKPETPDNVVNMSIPVSSIRKSPLRMFAAIAAMFVAVMFLVTLIQSEVDMPQPMAVALQSTETPIAETFAQPTKLLADFEIVQGGESNATVIVPETPTIEPVPAGASDTALRSVSPDSDLSEIDNENLEDGDAGSGANDDTSAAEMALEFSVTETAAMAILPTEAPLEMAMDATMAEQEFALDEPASDGADDVALFNTMEEQADSAEDGSGGAPDGAGVGNATGADLPDQATDSDDLSAVEKTNVSELLDTVTTQQSELQTTASAVANTVIQETPTAQETASNKLPTATTDDNSQTDSAPEQLPATGDGYLLPESMGLLVAQLISLVILGIWLLVFAR